MSFHTISKNQSKKEYKQSERGAIYVTDTKILRLILKGATLPHAPNFDEALDIEDVEEIRTITTSWV